MSEPELKMEISMTNYTEMGKYRPWSGSDKFFKLFVSKVTWSSLMEERSDWIEEFDLWIAFGIVQ